MENNVLIVDLSKTKAIYNIFRNNYLLGNAWQQFQNNQKYYISN